MNKIIKNMYFQVQENDFTGDGKKDELYIKFHLNIPPDRTVSSILLILSLDFQLKVFLTIFDILDI